MIGAKALLVLNKDDFHSMSLRRGFLYLTAPKYMFNCTAVCIRRPVYGEPAAFCDPIATLRNSLDNSITARMRDNL